MSFFSFYWISEIACVLNPPPAHQCFLSDSFWWEKHFSSMRTDCVAMLSTILISVWRKKRQNHSIQGLKKNWFKITSLGFPNCVCHWAPMHRPKWRCPLWLLLVGESKSFMPIFKKGNNKENYRRQLEQLAQLWQGHSSLCGGIRERNGARILVFSKTSSVASPLGTQGRYERMRGFAVWKAVRHEGSFDLKSSW